MKRLATRGALIAVVLCTALLVKQSRLHTVAAGGDPPHGLVIIPPSQGLALAPVALNLAGQNFSAVARGSYILNAISGCNDCHTCPSYAPGRNPFLGQPVQFNPTNYLAGGTPFGPFRSSNLTPDPATGLPAGLTLEQFINVMRTGQDPQHPGKLLQVMPWPLFQNMSDVDLRNIYAYLSAIPSAQPGVCTGAGQ